MLADHLGQGDYNLSFLYVMLVLITAGAFGWIGWIHRGAVRAAGAVTAIGLIAIAVAIVSRWEDVTNAMDRLDLAWDHPPRMSDRSRVLEHLTERVRA